MLCYVINKDGTVKNFSLRKITSHTRLTVFVLVNHVWTCLVWINSFCRYSTDTPKGSLVYETMNKRLEKEVSHSNQLQIIPFKTVPRTSKRKLKWKKKPNQPKRWVVADHFQIKFDFFSFCLGSRPSQWTSFFWSSLVWFSTCCQLWGKTRRIWWLSNLGIKKSWYLDKIHNKQNYWSPVSILQPLCFFFFCYLAFFVFLNSD